MCLVIRNRRYPCATMLLVLLLSVPLLSKADPSTERQAELDTLLYQDCGSCHGMTLRGGLGPSLLPEDMARYSTDAIAAIILHGVPGTAMPPWSALLSEEDAAWLADQLLPQSSDSH